MSDEQPTPAERGVPGRRRRVAVASAVAVAAGAGALGLVVAGSTGAQTPPATTTGAYPAGAARIVGGPLVFRLTTTRDSGTAFLVVARMDKAVRELSTTINDYASDAFQAPLLAHGTRRCYLTMFSGFGKRKGGRVDWQFPESVAGLKVGSAADVLVVDTSNPAWYPSPEPFPADATRRLRLRSPRGPHRTVSGQYSLRNERAQRELKRIGCQGTVRSSALRY